MADGGGDIRLSIVHVHGWSLALYPWYRPFAGSGATAETLDKNSCNVGQYGNFLLLRATLV